MPGVGAGHAGDHRAPGAPTQAEPKTAAPCWRRREPSRSTQEAHPQGNAREAPRATRKELTPIAVGGRTKNPPFRPPPHTAAGTAARQDVVPHTAWAPESPVLKT
ncbi:hypothetical protein Asp14428_53930 [Actinoplanes sp. NBRC 14428]|nr:hypothetical protein Asp14428_53930 [Actinoplanes sp. NBRC 14428]